MRINKRHTTLIKHFLLNVKSLDIFPHLLDQYQYQYLVVKYLMTSLAAGSPQGLGYCNSKPVKQKLKYQTEFVKIFLIYRQETIYFMVEEVPQNMSCISSATENIIMEVPQKILIKTFPAKLAYNGNSIIVFFKAPALECIFYDTWSSDIF